MNSRSDRLDQRQDTVTSIGMLREYEPRSSAGAGLQASMPVMPSPGLMIDQALPNLLMAVSAAGVLALGMFTPFGLPVWALGLIVPTVVLYIISQGVSRVLWRRAAVINLATVTFMFPLLVIRQSVIRVPFVDGANGTIMAPLMATLAAAGILILLGLVCAVLCQEDPELSGMLFLPAAMMVPVLAGQSDITKLSSALGLAIVVFLLSAIITLFASFLPGSAAAFIAPAAIGLEFLALTAFRSGSIFPTGAGVAAKILFASIVVVAVGLSIMVPLWSVWIRRVTRIAEMRNMRHSSPRLA